MLEVLELFKAIDQPSLNDCVKFMDTMKQSIQQNGIFFIQVGQQLSKNHPEFDNRALILIKGKSINEDNPDIFEYAVITREGPKKMTMTQEEFQNNFLVAYIHPRDTFLKGIKGRPSQISLHNGKTWDLEDLQTNGEDKDLLQYVFSGSIKAARQKLEAAKPQTLSGLLNHHPLNHLLTIFTT